MPLKTEAIKRFLIAKTHLDLAQLYTPSMEVQVYVAPDNGRPLTGEFRGRKWRGYTDDIQTWKPIRIPYNAAINPEYIDSELKWDLEAHTEGIGMTGWDWENKLSRWVGFDFDAIAGHSSKHEKKLSADELEEIKNRAIQIPWVTAHKSTSGRGLHIYVHLEAYPTANHTEHASLARAILGQMSALAGFNFSSKVDACGAILWVWHRKMQGTDGLSLIKQGTFLPINEIPTNWPEHVKVITNRKKSVIPEPVEQSSEELFKELCGQTTHIPLDSEHRKLIDYFQANDCSWSWNADSNMLTTHTQHLKEAHKALGLKGLFDTLTTHSSDMNCFCFPLRGGVWIVRRFSPGVGEHACWFQSKEGWTSIYYNKEPSLESIARTTGAVEKASGGFVFREAEIAFEALKNIGVILPKDLNPTMGTRPATVKKHKDGKRIIVEFEKRESDNNLEGWLGEKTKWQRIFNPIRSSIDDDLEIPNYDDIVRHLVTESGENSGWVIRSDDQWRQEPMGHLEKALASKGHDRSESNQILGSSIHRPWTIVNRPFQPEYLGNRLWNRLGAQFKFAKKQDTSNLTYSHWTKILTHCGQGLDSVVSTDPWCVSNGILTGGDYLKLWIASALQFPTEPLPYLFLWSTEQKTGKSIFYEAIQLLIKGGMANANTALRNEGGFNAELAHAVFCYVEEIDLRKDKSAYARIKEWTTAIYLTVHEKRLTPYAVRNTCHFIQCGNDPDFCPIFPGDSRITMIHVPVIDEMTMIPKNKLLSILEKEAQDFLTEVLNIEIPPSNDRLNIPIITTSDKISSQEINKSSLELFLSDRCYYVEGEMIKFSEFYDKFIETLDGDEIASRRWSKVAVGRLLPSKFPKGRNPGDAQYYIGNISFNNILKTRPKLFLINENLRHDSK